MHSFDSLRKSKAFALLIDPDKTVIDNWWIKAILASRPNFILIGGSQEFPYEKLDKIVITLKANCDIPLLIFPGSKQQIHPKVDGLLALSVLQSRKSKFILEQLIDSSLILSQTRMGVFYTPYLILSTSGNTAVEIALENNFEKIISKRDFEKYIQTIYYLNPPCVYLEAGSGADKSVSSEYIQWTANKLSSYLFVGGGIDSSQRAIEAWKAGADCIVIGNSVEKNLNFLAEVSSAREFILQN